MGQQIRITNTRDTEFDSTDTLQECSESISSSTTNMTGCRIKTWQVQTGKA